MLILAIDLGKYNSMCCKSMIPKRKTYFKRRNTRRHIALVLKSRGIDMVVTKASGPSGWINDVCEELESSESLVKFATRNC